MNVPSYRERDTEGKHHKARLTLSFICKRVPRQEEKSRENEIAVQTFTSSGPKLKMENNNLVCSAQGWFGPNVSTFSAEWDDNVNSFLKAPDVIKPPPQFRDPEKPSQAPPTTSSALSRTENSCVVSMRKERRGRPMSNIDLHRCSLSISSTDSSSLCVTRRRCESYALSYPSSSSEDSGSDSTSARKSDRLPDAVPQSRYRMIVLTKAKRKPAPPVRSVSLQRIPFGLSSEQKTQERHPTLLPDLIPTSKSEFTCQQSSPSSELSGKVGLNTSMSLRALNELRSSEPYKSAADSATAKSGIKNSPRSSKISHSPSSPSVLNSYKTSYPNPLVPSTDESSHCGASTKSANVDPHWVCRMPHQPSSASQKDRKQNGRLSLILPAIPPNAQHSDSIPAQANLNRRFSDTTQSTRPKQRNSMVFMPGVTQEDLNKVCLRSVASPEKTAEEVNQTKLGRNSSSPTKSPRAKPPVAPKPQRNKWPPHAITPSFVPASHEDLQRNISSDKQEDIYAMINKPKPSVSCVPNASSIEQTHHPRQQALNPNMFHPIHTRNIHELNKKRRAPTPPLTKTAVMKSSDSSQPTSSNLRSPKSPTSASQYHVTLYGVIPTEPENTNYDVKQEEIPDLGHLQLVGEEDDIFLYKSRCHTTEDLFTIIHRSKRKLLGRKDSFENKQGDPSTQNTGNGGSRISSQNDNFMAFLRKTRSAKAGCSGRISASELLKSSKPTSPQATNTSRGKD